MSQLNQQADQLQEQATAPEYWTTLSEYHQDDEYRFRVGEEFTPEGKPQNFFDAEGDEEKLLTPMKRRTFMKLSGFSAMAAALAACERPVHKVLPYVNKPAEITPGNANYYASALGTPEGAGLLIKTREGRPVKLEGNPDHPLTGGALGYEGQSELLKLYDPDRLTSAVEVNRQGETTPQPGVRMADLDQRIADTLRNASGKIVLLTPTIHGPSNDRIINDFGRIFTNFEHVMYDPLQDGMMVDAHERVFGEPVQPQFHYDKTDVLVCLGGDPLGQSHAPTQTQRQIGVKYHPEAEGGMMRIYAFEPVPTLTGMKADYRYQINPTSLLEIALGLANEIIVKRGSELQSPMRDFSSDSQLMNLLNRHSLTSAAQASAVDVEELRRMADNLMANQGRALIDVTGAAVRGEDGENLHLAAIMLNMALGSYGSTLDIQDAPSLQVRHSHRRMLQLVQDMKGGLVDVLIFFGVNPVYTLPPDSGIKEALAEVGTVVSLSTKPDETVQLCDLALPGVHSLENWGDGEPVRGLYNLQQPAIRPLFSEESADPNHETRAWQESLMAFARAAGSIMFEREPDQEVLQAAADREGVSIEELPEDLRAPKPISWHDYIKETWQQGVYPRASNAADFENFWIDTLMIGFVDQRGQSVPPETNPGNEAFYGIQPAGAHAGLTLTMLPTANHGSGESMGIPHMLEMPDPVTKVSWDNYVLMSPSRAVQLGVEDGRHVKITAGGREIVGPARIQPGVHPDVLGIYLGWGRDTQDGIGHMIGINGYAVTQVSNNKVIHAGIPATVERVSGRTSLADAQGHAYLYSPSYAGVMTNYRKGEVPEGATRNENGKPVYERPIIGETTLNEWKKDPSHGYPNSAGPGEEIPSMWGAKHHYLGHHWAMVVDLNSCISCGACMMACNIENNVPVVGKDELAMGREMFWIRIDRYYRGDKENPDFANMPLMCQHCDNAPCETVCPVVATLHNNEGINLMVYNRCVGTRYCANNCPYKVRRFNFWQYSDWRTGPAEKKKMVSPLELVLNPDVTTRSRGVMEKCTFCLQRQRTAKDTARMEGRKLRDGDVQTACQQACPSQAISFGDRNDPNAKVARLWDDPRSYGLLADLNTDPSVKYLALVRNRDEPSPYRTKYQSHRVDHNKGHGKDHGHSEHGDDSHEHDH